MKVAIIGADGQLGTDLMKVGVGHTLIPLMHSDLEISDLEACRRITSKLRPEIIINTAAFHQTDLAEDEIEKAFLVNAFGPRNLALASKGINAFLVQMSTDYVFDGHKKAPYLESDMPCPENAYGVSKVAGEQFVRYLLGNRRMIVRSSGLFGLRGSKAKGGKNFIENVLEWITTREEARIVNDQRFSPTYTLHLAQKIFELIERGVHGTVHVTNSGDCTWYEFAQAILETVDVSHVRLVPMTTEESGTKSQRPTYSVLGHGRLKEWRLDDLPTWQEALREYLKAREVIRLTSRVREKR